MKRTASLLLSALFFVFLFFRSTEAHALGPLDVEVGARLGYATNPNSDVGNPLGTGVGARGGIELFHRLYAGVNAMYYFGTSQNTPLGVEQQSTHSLLLGFELGYSLHVSILTIRPQLGIGEANITSFAQFNSAAENTAVIPNNSVTYTHTYLEPGLVALINVGIVYVGADANILVITGANEADGNAYTSFAFGAQAGLRF